MNRDTDTVTMHTMHAPSAYPLSRAAQLAGLSERQVRTWARDGFYTPHFESGLYSFRDIVALRTLGILRNERGIPLQTLKKFGKWLRARHDEPWASLRFATAGKEVLFREGGKRLVSGDKPGQYADVVPFPIDEVELTVRTAATAAAARKPDQFGQVAKRRGLMGSRPCVAGTGVTINSIWEFHEAGFTTDQILDEYPVLTSVDVEAAIEAKQREAS